MYDNSNEMIGRLLGDAVGELDIPLTQREAAIREYRRVGDYLAEHADGPDGWEVFPQGSFLLGTVVRPDGADEYDVDSVCRRNIAKEATTQALLKSEVGSVLGSYGKTYGHLPDGPVSLRARRRCWTLGYRPGLRFHLDVLPAIPNPEGAPTALLITDRELRQWQRTDPLAYAEWFRSRAQSQFLAKRAALAEARRVEPAEIPVWEVQTTLHRTVQVLKLHRNAFFAEDLDSRPPSILITTLAAHAYNGETELYGSVIAAVEGMAAHIAPGPYVANPVEPRENFAERWQESPALELRFREWLAALAEDLREASSTRGLDSVVTKLSESFGAEGPLRKAAGELADSYRGSRERGALGFAAGTGILSTGGGVPVRNHDFYGEIE